MSPEYREKLGEKVRGRVVTKETVQKILKTKRERGTLAKGDKHDNWKGGKLWMRFRDPRYIVWRNDVLERDEFVCQDCGKQ